MKFNPTRPAKLSFALQSKLGNLLPFEKAYDQIDAGGPPFGDVHLQPIIGARTGHDGEPPRHLNPMQSGHSGTSAYPAIACTVGVGALAPADSRIDCIEQSDPYHHRTRAKRDRRGNSHVGLHKRSLCQYDVGKDRRYEHRGDQPHNREKKILRDQVQVGVLVRKSILSFIAASTTFTSRTLANNAKIAPCRHTVAVAHRKGRSTCSRRDTEQPSSILTSPLIQ